MPKSAPRLVISAAGQKGKGVFAAASIPAATVVTTFRGPGTLVWDIPEKLWPYSFQVDYDRYVVPEEGSAGWFINHSCEPNCQISGRSVTTARAIAPGEELVFDYSTDVDWPGFEMACNCGAPHCRRVVKAYRFLSAEAKVRYGKHVAPYIARKYLAGSHVRRSAKLQR